jgi:hypothetical protein
VINEKFGRVRKYSIKRHRSLTSLEQFAYNDLAPSLLVHVQQAAGITGFLTSLKPSDSGDFVAAFLTELLKVWERLELVALFEHMEGLSRPLANYPQFLALAFRLR